MSPEQAAVEIETEHPAMAAKFDTLKRANIGAVIIGSRNADWAARQCDTRLRKPDDWDMLVLQDQFWDAVAVTGAEVEQISVATVTGDSLPIEFFAYEAKASIDKDVLQFMHIPDGVMVGGKHFVTGLTPEGLRASAAMHCGRLPFAHPAIATEIYCLRQAGPQQGKDDLNRSTIIWAAALLGAYDPHPGLYTAIRAAEANWDERMHAFDARAAAGAIKIAATIRAATATHDTPPPQTAIPLHRRTGRPALAA